jgi:hypothetical protein
VNIIEDGFLLHLHFTRPVAIPTQDHPGATFFLLLPEANLNEGFKEVSLLFNVVTH